jgi:hypothetical protein
VPRLQDPAATAHNHMAAHDGGGAPLVSAPLSMLRESDSIEDAWLVCPHLPPYADVRPVVLGDFLNHQGESYPDGMNHYCVIGRCQGTKKDGKPCDYKCMLQNAYLPLTRVRLANGEIFKFKSWTNPCACRDQGDVVRAAEGQVEGKRGWHKFWFAVHHLGAHMSGQQQVSQDQLELWASWLRDKAKDFRSNMSAFQDAGLLVEGGPGDGDAGVRAKFMRAQHVLQHYNGDAHDKFMREQQVLGMVGGGGEPSGATPASLAATPFHGEALVYIESTVSEFRDDMRKFIQDFLKPTDQPAPRKWNLCELLIVAFMQEKGAYDPEIAQTFDSWRSKCFDPTVNLIDEFHEMMMALEPPIFTQINHESLDALSDGTADGKPFPFSGGKRNHISIFVIDWMVQHRDSPWALPLLFRKEWKKKVVLQWFNNAETSDDFLGRAEDFLQNGEKWGITILGRVIQTN